MRFYEVEAKRILAKQGIPVVKGAIAATASEAERVASEAGGPVVLKAQVLYPGKTDVTRRASSAGEARTAADELLRLEIGGRKPKGVLVEGRGPVSKELCVS